VKKLPKKQSVGLEPLISSGVEKVSPWSVDIEPKIGDSEKLPLGWLNLNTVHVT